MIDIRSEVEKHNNWIVRLLTKSDYLYDSLTDLPDFHCSSVRDFEGNSSNIRNGRSVLLPRAIYQPEDSPNRCTIRDCTGRLEVKPSFWQRERVESLDKGDFLYDVYLTKKKDGVYLTGFEIRGPICLEGGSAEEYLTAKFPRLVPVLLR